MASPSEASLTLAAESVAFTVIWCVPSESAEDVIDQLPLPSAVAVPREVLPALKSSTVALVTGADHG